MRLKAYLDFRGQYRQKVQPDGLSSVVVAEFFDPNYPDDDPIFLTEAECRERGADLTEFLHNRRVLREALDGWPETKTSPLFSVATSGSAFGIRVTIHDIKDPNKKK